MERCLPIYIDLFPLSNYTLISHTAYLQNPREILIPSKYFLPSSPFHSLFFLGCYSLSRCKVKTTQVEPTSLEMKTYFPYEDIIAATEDLDLKYCIRSTGYGSVCKAQLPSAQVVALKKLHHREAEEPGFNKSFKNEVKLLTSFMGFVYTNEACFLFTSPWKGEEQDRQGSPVI